MAKQTPGKPIKLTIAGQKKVMKELNSVLAKHGVDGKLKEFKLTTMEGSGGCPPGTSWGCRVVGAAVICRCWPD